MTAWTLALAGALLCAATFSGADDATEIAIERLSDGLEGLENELARAEEAPQSFQDRLEDARMELVYLKVKSRKHKEAGGEGTGLSAEEVEQLSDTIAIISSDWKRHVGVPDAKASSDGSATLTVGTQFSARLQDSLTTEYAQIGDAFTAITEVDVTQDSHVVIQAGSLLHGVVEQIDRPDGRFDRGGKLVLAFERIEIRDREHALTATVIGASEKLESGLGDEKAKLGASAGLGAVLGALLGGKKGAVVGGILGGSGAILATEGKHVELDRGTILSVRLDRDFQLR